MKFKICITILFIGLLTLNACEKKQKIIKVMYADMQPQIDAYSAKAMKIWASNEKLAVSYLNDSIQNLITGTYISDYKFNLVNSSYLNTNLIQKPIYLQVGGRTCASCRAELPALNDIVDKYNDEISFILLSQYDSKETLLKALDEYHEDIILVYYSLEENKNNKQSDPALFSGFKHLKRAVPTNYLINKDRQIIKLTGGAIVPRSYIDDDGKEITVTEEEAYQKNFKKLEQEIELLLTYQ